MTRPPAPGPSGRAAAVGDLFAALEGLLISYQALPDEQRDTRWDAEAELITGAVALHLSTARGRIAARSVPSAPPRAVPAPTDRPAAPRLSAGTDTDIDTDIDTGIEPNDDRRPA
ncbi:hypothetical protein [Pseudonocardia humida]|uniref:Uncharacterized protein n=1 Tax=Pseudonocardia humida TaxID=2800819 RepID=A0ABT1AC94_9PSEU|nr:hypothetical protein [Pseudonocardia humida]MCO1660660.1 hypothetical protein [Pseudonocardia humida]